MLTRAELLSSIGDMDLRLDVSDVLDSEYRLAVAQGLGQAKAQLARKMYILDIESGCAKVRKCLAAARHGDADAAESVAMYVEIVLRWLES